MSDAPGSSSGSSSGSGDKVDSARKKLEKKYEDLATQLKESYDRLQEANKKEKKKRRLSRGRLGQGSLGPASGGGPDGGSSVKPVAFYGIEDGNKKREEYNAKQREWYAARKAKLKRTGPVEGDDDDDISGNFADVV
eukprot:Seg3181.3 transcript_id=Seg3181.3/GoldUCD/mRNA.D3Y31 product="hypothetical protein" protein_id=Seg3181.3/GoldUCD/D3Y31